MGRDNSEHSRSRNSEFRVPSSAFVAALSLLSFISGLYVVLLHQVPIDGDPVTTLLSGVALREALVAPSAEAFGRWLELTGYRPPLPTLLHLPLLFTLTDQALAMKVTELAVFAVCVWLVYRVGIQLSGRPAGAVAALLFAAYPTIQGISRLGNADPVIWLTLLLLLRVLVTLDLRSTRQAVVLGLAAGLCLATRLLCLVYLVGPVVWLLVFHVRSRRAAVNLLVAGACCLVPAGWWYAVQADVIQGAAAMSSETQADAGIINNLEFYLRSGWFYLPLAVAPALALAIWRRALEPGRWWLVLAWLLPPVVQLLLVWDVNDHYPMPLVPVCMLLLAVTVHRLTAAWRARRRIAAWAALLVAGLLPIGTYYSDLDFWPQHAEGIMEPDVRAHDGIFRVLAQAPAGAPVLSINDTDLWRYPQSLVLGRNPPPARLVDLMDLTAHHREVHGVRYVLHTVRRCELVARHRRCEPPRVLNSWWQAQGATLYKERLAVAVDPNGVEFRLWKMREPVQVR